MKPLWFVLAACVATDGAAADVDRLCQAALSAAEHFAAERGWQAEVRCRGVGAVADGATLQAIDPPPGAPLRSGPSTWNLRVQAPGAAAYLQRVPLTIAWSAPAWVSQRDLPPGTPLRDDDVELLRRRWPDGVVVVAAREDARPSGRLRQAVRSGELVTAAQLLPADTLVRGDSVTAVLADGAMEIRMPARLLAPARVGERARAQVQGRAAALEGRLADAQTLKVDSP